MFLLVPAYPGCPGQTAVKWLLLLFQDNLGTAAHKSKPFWISMRQTMTEFWDAVASAGPYANNLHLAQTNKHTNTSSLNFTGLMPNHK